MSDAVIERLVAERDALRDCLLGIALSDRYRRYPKQHEDGGVRGQSGLRAVRSLTGQHGSYLSDEDVVRLDKEARAMLAASPSVGGWGDISTAPKDGTLVDLWTSYGERVAGAKWTNGVWREWALDGFDSMGWVRLEGTATHWMPLPPPPSVSTGSRPQEAILPQTEKGS